MIKDMMRKIAAASVCATLACSPDGARVDATAGASADTVSAKDSTGVILFLGTSLTAGYGIGAVHAYPALIQQKIDSAGYDLRVVNAGISGETSAGGLRRIDWSLQEPVEILVLELGANDGLRGLSVADMRKNLTQIMERTRARYPEASIVIAGMEAPPNLGTAYTTEFRNTYRDLARKYDATLIPFLLEGVALVSALNQDDGLHPNEQGQQRIAQTVWTALEPIIRQREQSRVQAATR